MNLRLTAGQGFGKFGGTSVEAGKGSYRRDAVVTSDRSFLAFAGPRCWVCPASRITRWKLDSLVMYVPILQAREEVYAAARARNPRLRGAAA